MHSIVYDYGDGDFSPALLIMISSETHWIPPYNLITTRDAVNSSIKIQ